MNAREFFELVSKMRKAQKDYFATRTNDALSKSKQLEREVDAEIKRVDTIIKGDAVQQKLF